MKDFKLEIEEYRQKPILDVLNFLFSFWGVENLGQQFKLIGIYEKSDKPDKNGKEYGFFKEIRSGNGDLLYYPFRLGLLNIWAEHRDNLLLSKFQQINVQLDFKKNRERNPFKLSLSNNNHGTPKNSFIDRTTKEKIIKKIFNETGYTEIDARNTSNALKRIAGDLYTEPERFIFELLQNADDIPNEGNEVNVKFKLLKENFLFLHSGKPFNSRDVESISSIGDSTKRKDSEKTGYKGIGFKSVFTDAETVLINSGNFSFSFDKHSDFYQGKNIEEIPWEIKPIWTELYRYPKEVRDCSDFFNYPVAIGLELGELKGNLYKEIISNLFQEPRFILFLRNIKTIKVEGTSCDVKIEKNKIGNKFELLSNGKSVNHWLINDFEFDVSQSVRDSIADDKLVPEKLKGILSSKISFACQLINDRICPINPESSYLFTYLPTNVNDYKFPFLVNADFLTTANRPSIHIKNPWNLYIFEQIGYLCFKWIASLANKSDYYNSVYNLIPDKLTNPSDQIHLHFCKGFNKALSEISFIPTIIGTLEKVSNILIDETGLAILLKEDFIEISGLNQNLIHSDVKEGIEKLKYLMVENKIGAIYTIENLKINFKNEIFQKWLKIPNNNLKIISHLFHSPNSSLKSLLETESLILSETNQLNKSVFIYNNLPAEVTFIEVEILNKELSILLIEQNITLKFKTYEPTSFFKENILGKQNLINIKLSTQKELLNFWSYVYDNYNQFEIEKPIIESLKYFFVLCKPTTTEFDTKAIISTAYMALEFNFFVEVETVIRNLEIQNASFISPKYLRGNRIDEKWRKIFKQAAAITDLQKVIEILLPKLTTIEISKHFEVAKQIFKFWKEPTNRLTEEQINLIKSNLKIRCIDKQFRKSSDCYISDHFNNNQLIISLLPSIELSNQIAQEYAPKTNQVAEWKNFFLLIGGIELIDNQKIFHAKINTLISNQDEFRENHFELLKVISGLHKGKKENGLNFNFENSLSQIKLLTTNNQWHLPNKIHLSNLYRPKLNLQNDEAVNSTLFFLSDKYIPIEIEKNFLIDIGLNDGFFFKKLIPHIQIDKVQEHKFIFQLEQIEKYRLRLQEIQKMTQKDLRGYLIRSYTNDKIRLVTSVTNHLLINYPQLLSIPKYAESFLKFAIKNKALDILSTETEIKIWNNNIYKHPNYIVWLLQTNTILANQEDKYVKPTELFSFRLSSYIINKGQLPKINYATEIATNGKSLEEVLGIQQILTVSHCIELLCRVESKISFQEISQLQIVKSLMAYTPNMDEKSKLFLLNKIHEWKPISQLFISTDEQFKLDPAQQLHEEFYSIADNFGIQKLSEENLVLKTNPKNLSVTDEIVSFFDVKAKFIAFKIEKAKYTLIESALLEKINQYTYYEVLSVERVFPERNPIYKGEIEFYINHKKNEIFYKGNWKTNEQIKEFLFGLIQHKKIEMVWFGNLINRWDDSKIIEKLNEEVGATPSSWEPVQNKNRENERDYIKEVRDFIEEMRKVEDIYDADKIEELKSILADFIDHPDEKKNTYNMLAKLKLCKRLKLNFNRKWGFNTIEEGPNKFFIHSARGSFAYIHPHEIIQMRDNEFKIAIDYGSKDIKIYNSCTEILELYSNYLMLYQGKPSKKDILRICDENQHKTKFHFLIIDKEKQTDDAMAILKILNTDNYE